MLCLQKFHARKCDVDLSTNFLFAVGMNPLNVLKTGLLKITKIVYLTINI